MAEFENLPNDYEDERAHHLCRRPHDVLAGWTIVAVALIFAVMGFGIERISGVHCSGPGMQRCMIGAVAVSDAPKVEARSAPLAEEVGMAPRRHE
jgi:hypothetical protein